MWFTSKATAACALMVLMVLVMKETAARSTADSHSKHLAKTHKSSDLSDGAESDFVALELDPKALHLPKHIRPVENVSISPWTYNISKDDSMFPPVMSEARCLLNGCLDSEGVEDLNLESRPIFHQVLVLRRVKPASVGHSYHYRLESRLITVGCTCVRVSIHQHH
ncbi:interleukin 17a/f1 [Thalassophryne amazonica]|uniref:interleukin 17a/f1 n=1 Tax=Thalassophryne amazonica TaxID=390379 RepID=UPI001471A78E|nr:interleukin 17a/f1 [Thalassophryne amazonica]